MFGLETECCDGRLALVSVCLEDGMLREGTLFCVWQELVFNGNGVHMERGTSADSRCLCTYLVHISPMVV